MLIRLNNYEKNNLPTVQNICTDGDYIAKIHVGTGWGGASYTVKGASYNELKSNIAILFDRFIEYNTIHRGSLLCASYSINRIEYSYPSGKKFIDKNVKLA